MTDAAIVDLPQAIARAIRHEVTIALVDASRIRRVIAIPEAMSRYGRDRSYIRGVVENPKNGIRHTWIPGRGAGGKELSINLADLDHFFGVV